MRNFFYILITGLLFSACEKVIKFDKKTTSPLLVVSAYITPDSSIRSHISKSSFFLDDENTRFDAIENADLILFVNDVEYGKLTSIGNGYYHSDYKPKVGESIKIEVTSKDYLSAYAKTEIPQKPVIIQVNTTSRTNKKYEYVGGYDHQSYNSSNIRYDTLGIQTYKKVNFRIKFKDDGANKNYYRLVVLKKTYSRHAGSFGNKPQEVNEYLLSEQYLDHFEDIIFENHKTETSNIFGEKKEADYSYDTFSDNLINGKEYELKFSDESMINSSSYTDPKSEFTELSKIEYYIYLQQISKDYYLYSKSYTAAIKSTGNPFVEPVQIHSNIQNGIGLFASYTSSDAFVITVKN